MKKSIIIVLISVIVTSLFLSTQQPGDAQTSSSTYGYDDKYLTKVKVEKLKQGSLWAYIVKACATDRHLAIASVVLKSDIDEKFLGVNKNLRKGDCTYYGAVMNAKDGKTLGADLIEKHEALEKLQKSYGSTKPSQNLVREIFFYKYIFG